MMSNLKKIFVSRELKKDSPLSLLSRNHTLTARSLIEFSPLVFDTPEADWIFFYSRNAVKYFFQADNYSLYPYLWACMSHGTAEELKEYVLDISFVGNGTPISVAEQFAEVRAAQDTACFIRANQSIDSVRNLLGKNNDFSIAAYNNLPSKNVPEANFDILIFTSPMNVNTYYETFPYRGQNVISIGDTTANALRALGIKDILIANEPSEKGLADQLEIILTS